MTVDVPPWHQRAACAGTDYRLWFPPGAPPNDLLDTCRRCPVRAECLYDALKAEGGDDRGRRAGVYGGLGVTARALMQLPPGPRSAAVAALRAYLTEHHPPGRTRPHMATAPAPPWHHDADAAPDGEQKRKPGSYARDYNHHEVRAWAAANGIDCTQTGQIPKRVLDAWRARDMTNDSHPTPKETAC